ncbi:flagellar hook-length control protein FliK [Parvibium lacunae]|uniref:Flagellar hook-length control protein FliK n=1 Tax=Parvibium lacunae TaxID=1888893 RepID=A0A368L3X7_9BURK|nr:flagellar hook-length control protein FliK [Parvibium lacunae]RCS58225.1 flagellar hook-length control protein FliK [Parvibium lacunae]
MVNPITATSGATTTLEALQGPRASRLGVVLAVLAAKGTSDLTKQFINQSLPARVLENLTDGTTKVAFTLPDQRTLTTQVRLPQLPLVGSDLLLQLTEENSPINPSGQTAVSSQINNAAGNKSIVSGAVNAPTNVASNLSPESTLTTGSAIPKLSQIALLVGQILGAEQSRSGLALGGALPAGQMAIRSNLIANSSLSTVPLPNSPNNSGPLASLGIDLAIEQLGMGAGKHIAPQLQQMIQQSGLFYESHLQEWANGQRPLQALLTEPQTLLTQRVASNVTTETTPTAAPNTISTSNTTVATTLEKSTAETFSALPDQRLPMPNPALLPLVREQLQVLDTRGLLLQLQAWPQQAATLIIEEHPSGSTTTETPNKAWQMRLNMHLPQLGQVEANMTLVGDSLQFRWQIQDPDTQALLQSEQPSLNDALAAAGLHIQQWQVAPTNLGEST